MLISRDSANLITNELSVIMRHPVLLTDDSGLVISSTVPVQVGTQRAVAIKQLKQDREYSVLCQDDPCQEEIFFPITIDDHLMGAVGIIIHPEERSDIIEHYGDIIRRTAEVRVRRLSRRMSRDEEEGYFERARQIFFESTIFSDILSESLNSDDLAFRASLLGIDLTQPRVMVVLAFDTDSSFLSEGAFPSPLSQKNIEEFALRLRDSLRHQQKQNLCFTHHQKVVMLLCATTTKAALETSTKMCEDLESFYSIRIFGGISSVAQSPGQFKARYHEAKMACSIAQTSQRKMLLTYDITSPVFISHSLTPEIKAALYQSVFGNLGQEEIHEISQLILTYSDLDGNIEQTAAKLHVHRNTLLYRMNKVKSTTGFNMKSPKDLFILYLTVLSSK